MEIERLNVWSQGSDHEVRPVIRVHCAIFKGNGNFGRKGRRLTIAAALSVMSNCYPLASKFEMKI